MSDISSRWVLTRGLIASGGTPLESKSAISGTRGSEGLVRALGMCQALMKLVSIHCANLAEAVASTGPA
jgi:hypothetical protein